VAIAEELGYQRAWLYDSPAVYPDVWMVLSRCAERTSRIGLGPGVLVPSLRHPMVNAAAIAELVGQAPGRVAVAIGSGFSGRLALGKRPMPWRQVADYIRYRSADQSHVTVSAHHGARSTGAAHAPTALLHPLRRFRAIEYDGSEYAGLPVKSCILSNALWRSTIRNILIVNAAHLPVSLSRPTLFDTLNFVGIGNADSSDESAYRRRVVER
jgi:Luciferase-like monooxygenase